MSKHFLTKSQQEDLKAKGWNLISARDGCVWVGADWDSKQNMLQSISNLDLIDLDRGVQGYNFLIIGYNEEYNEEEKTK